jgi:hypothetical protein
MPNHGEVPAGRSSAARAGLLIVIGQLKQRMIGRQRAERCAAQRAAANLGSGVAAARFGSQRLGSRFPEYHQHRSECPMILAMFVVTGETTP